jgi:hypothetical protein
MSRTIIYTDRKCEICNKVLTSTQKMFCSREHYEQSLRGKSRGPFTEEHKANIKKTHWAYSKNAHKVARKVSKHHADFRGSKHPNWKGGSKNRKNVIYEHSEHWREIKNSYDGKPCDLCGELKSRMVVHHTNYNCLGHETPDDLQRLCNDCHFLCHRILRTKCDSEFFIGLQQIIRKYFEYEKLEGTTIQKKKIEAAKAMGLFV